MASAAPDRHSRLYYLTVLLDGLPEYLPTPGLDPTATYYVDLTPPFTVDQAHITRHNGNEAEAFCWVLHTIFVADGEWQIVERGESIGAVIGVLEIYLKKYSNNPRILEWIDEFIIALEAFYHEKGLPVRNHIILVLFNAYILTYKLPVAFPPSGKPQASAGSTSSKKRKVPPSDNEKSGDEDNRGTLTNFVKGKAALAEETDGLCGNEIDGTVIFGPVRTRAFFLLFMLNFNNVTTYRILVWINYAINVP